jgi:hypothetical protein
MGEIDKLPPAYRIPPTRPPAAGGDGKRAPQRKPATGEHREQGQRRRKPGQDEPPHVDEYV